jgi:thiol-disulfide isomerase/thioredoxin
MKQPTIILLTIIFLAFKTDYEVGIEDSFPAQSASLLNKKVPHFSGWLLNDSVVDETILTNKIVLLNFMFIGCQGCMQELPNLARLYEEYNKSNFMIVTIMGNGIPDIRSYQETGDKSKVFYQIRKMGKYENIKNIIIAECKSIKRNGPTNGITTCTDNISKKFNIIAYPTNLLIDETGIIRKIYHNLSDDSEFLDLQDRIAYFMDKK